MGEHLQVRRELKSFKVLSIDGGGIRGLYSAKLLETFEQRFGTRTVDQFDMICGTSTGGLIALALALGFSAAEVVAFYHKHGPRIFPPHRRIWGLVPQILGRGKYSNQALKRTLDELFGDKRIGDAKSLLCVPSYSITHGRPYIFRYDHDEGDLGRDNNVLCADAALATSAAPTFFPIVEITGAFGQLIDGGMAANNPALVGLMESLRYFVGAEKAYPRAQVLSIETLRVPSKMHVQRILGKGAVLWREDLVNSFMEGQTQLTNHVLRELHKAQSVPFDYLRIPSPDVSPKQAKFLGMDDARPRSLKQIETIAAGVADEWAVKDKLKSLFSTGKSYELNH